VKEVAMQRSIYFLILMAVAAMLTGCGKDTGPKQGPSVATADVKEIRELLQSQIAAMGRGDVDGVRQTFAIAVRDKITPAVLSSGSSKFARADLEKLFAKIEPVAGREALRVKNADDKTVATMMVEDGAWVAESLWFTEEPK
jgi:hypothetical protein